MYYLRSVYEMILFFLSGRYSAWAIQNKRSPGPILDTVYINLMERKDWGRCWFEEKHKAMNETDPNEYAWDNFDDEKTGRVSAHRKLLSGVEINKWCLEHATGKNPGGYDSTMMYGAFMCCLGCSRPAAVKKGTFS